jgi:nitroimidazol reductase NimA-like FMN-containing flavoprotein (pyridoxamine 5'-phosphate oxidase superfamily)
VGGDLMNDAIGPAPERQALAAHSVESLREEECWGLLGTRGIGRLAAIGPDGGPDIFPVNTLLHERKVYFRSGPGMKLVQVTAEPRVAVEFDGGEPPWRWSVVIRGTARRLDRDDEIEASGVADLVSLSPTPKDDFVCVEPSVVSGRRFRTDYPSKG